MTNRVALGNVVQINPSSIGKSFLFDEIDYIDISSVGTGNLSGINRMKLVDAPSRAKRLVAHGDTILATVRPNLRSFLYIKNPTPNTVASTGFAVLRATDKIDQRYLYYSVTSQSFTDYLSANVKGAAYPAVDTEAIARGTINLPALSMQQKIAAILSAYDDLIENNLKRIKILEEMAQMIYREWFINFRFPGHEKVKMVKSELGMIPEGWEVKRIADCADFRKGKKARNIFEESRPDAMPYLLINGLRNRNFLYTDDPKMVIASTTDIMMVMDGASSGQVFIGFSGAVGSTLGIYNTRNEKQCSPYLLYLFLLDNFKGISEKNIGSAIPHANKDYINSMNMTISSPTVMNSFNDLAGSIYSQIDLLERKTIILSKTRDLLLPKLISGEIDLEKVNINVGAESV